MKKSVRQGFGVLLSIAWFVIYVGGGSYLFASQAVRDINHIPTYTPVILFLWIVGFFVGHITIEKFFLFLGSLFEKRVEQINVSTLENIDNLSITNIATPYQFSDTINVKKKSTNKISLKDFNFGENIYKTPLKC